MFITDFRNITIMKTNTLIKFAAICIAISTIFSCVNDDDFNVPENLGIQESKVLNRLLDSIAVKNNGYNIVSYQNLKERYKAQFKKRAFKIETNDVIKGYVTSSDASGNFYKEFFIQDATENPTSGLRVALNQSDSYNKFNLGREVYIHLNGLYVGESKINDGVISIGGHVNEDGEIEALSNNQIKNLVLRSKTTKILQPLLIKPSQVSASQIGVLTTFENVNFPKNLQGLPYVNPNDQYDSKRSLQFCDGFNLSTFSLETSTYANFRNEALPKGAGSITGVISKTYNGSQLIMALNTTADVNFTNQDACTPLNTEDYQTILEERFDGISKSDINKPGWVNYKEQGSVAWRGGNYKDDGYASFSAFKSGDKENIAWLILPSINLESYQSEFLSFETAYAFPVENHKPLEVLISTNFDGTNVNNASWETLAVKIASTTNASKYEYVKSGLVDLSSYTGKLYVAFKYTGSGTDELTTTMRVDNIKVLAEK